MIGYFDGASRGNPGESGAGACLVREDGNAAWECAKYLGKKTNNEAEYTALLLLLNEARARGLTRLEIRGDSKLVVCQFNREWKINKPHLRELAVQAWELAEGLCVRVAWVPRELNKLADTLSNRAIDERAANGSP